MLYHRYANDQSVTYFWNAEGQLCLRILRSKDRFRIHIHRKALC